MTDRPYTPTTDEVLQGFISSTFSAGISALEAHERADRWLDSIEAAVEQRGAVKALRAVMELHAKRDDLQTRGGKPICDGCGDTEGWASEYPCPTVQAITDAMEGDDD